MPQLMKTSNPALNSKIFQGQSIGLEEPMTLDGTVNKTGILLLCCLASAAYSWHVFRTTQSVAAVSPLLWIGAIGGLIFALITIFQKTWAPVTAPIYSLLEGLALGSISAIFELRFPGIAIESVAMTFGVLFVMLLAYRSHIIPVTQKLRLGIVACTGANTEAKFLMLQHAFEVWNALRISLHTDSRNLRSQASMERIGFKREGILRAHKIATDSIPRDSVRYSMIADEWPDAKERLIARLYAAEATRPSP